MTYVPTTFTKSSGSSIAYTLAQEGFLLREGYTKGAAVPTTTPTTEPVTFADLVAGDEIGYDTDGVPYLKF